MTGWLMRGFCWITAPKPSGVARAAALKFESLVLTFSRLQALVAAAADSQACGTHEVGLKAE